jgi:voltage-gated potassium channel
MVLILAGVGALGFSFGTFIDFMVEGHLRGLLEGRRMNRAVENLEGHHIVAGLGRVGTAVARKLAEEDVPFVVIDQCEECLAEATERDWLRIEGDATDEGVLLSAGIGKARSLITTLDTDADNLFVALTARTINPDLFIVARSSHESSEAKLLRAGADRVKTPNLIGGRRMAAMVLQPVVSDYLDIVTHGDDVEFTLQQVDIDSRSQYANTSIKESQVRARTGAYILAVMTADGTVNTNPASDTVMRVGDKLVVLGTTEQLQKLTGVL